MELVGLIIFGGVIGALARLVMPGDQNLGILWTIILGALGALVGYWLSGVLGVEDTPGIDWIRWIISTVAAVLFISIYIGIRGRQRV